MKWAMSHEGGGVTAKEALEHFGQSHGQDESPKNKKGDLLVVRKIFMTQSCGDESSFLQPPSSSHCLQIMCWEFLNLQTPLLLW